MPELPPAAVERYNAATMEWATKNARQWLKPNDGMVLAGLTAALRLDDPETVERVAKAILKECYGERVAPVVGSHPEELAAAQREARVAISALLGAEDDA